MLILNLGVPRSGTVLVFNVIRQILLSNDVRFTILNANERQSEQYFVKNHDHQSRHLLMHTHTMGPRMAEAIKGRRGVVAFYNFRDPRDVLVSLIGLHDHSFEEALEFTDRSFVHLRGALGLRRIMFIPYRHLIAAPAAFVFMIGQRLGVILDLATVERICSDTDVDRHATVMRQVRKAPPEGPGIRVWNNRHRALKESADLLITDRHIQSGRVGRWRDELTPRQQQLATERFSDVIARLGFEAS